MQWRRESPSGPVRVHKTFKHTGIRQGGGFKAFTVCTVEKPCTVIVDHIASGTLRASVDDKPQNCHSWVTTWRVDEKCVPCVPLVLFNTGRLHAKYKPDNLVHFTQILSAAIPQRTLCTKATACIGETGLDAQHDGAQWQGGVLNGPKAPEVAAHQQER